MLRDKISVVCMVCNEAYWIELVLRPVLALGLPLYIADCASTDDTPNIILNLCTQYGPSSLLYFERYEHITPTQNGQVRASLAHKTQTPWILQIDGDEIWLKHKLDWLMHQDIPSETESGFVHVQNVLWQNNQFVLADGISQHRLHRRDANWHGDYPFESTDAFNAPNTIYFSEGPHAYHVRYLQRSPHDATTYMRTEKLTYFDPRERAIYTPIDLFAQIGNPTYPNPYYSKDDENV